MYRLPRLSARAPGGVPARLLLAGAVALACLGAPAGAGAQPAPATFEALAERYGVETWGRHEGLPQSHIEALARTYEGYLWAGTRAGLARFDGQRFRVYTRADHPGLPSDVISALAEGPPAPGARAGPAALWIGTDGGLAVLVRGRVRAVADGAVTALAADGPRMWIGGTGSLRVFDGAAVRPFADAGLAGARVFRLARASGGAVYAGTDKGLFRIRDGHAVLIPLPGVPDGARSVRALAVEPGGAVWAGTEGGVFRVDAGRASRVAALDACGAPRGFALTPDGLWVATARDGLCRLDTAGVHRVRTADGLPTDLMNGAVVGDDGTLWVGTVTRGLVALRRGPFLTLDPTGEASNPFAVLETRDGALWLGASNGVVARLSAGRVARFGRAEGLPDGVVSVLAEASDGALWAAAGAGGVWSLCRLAPAAARFRCTRTPHQVFGLTADARGHLLAGMNGRVLAVRPDGRLDTLFAVPSRRPRVVRLFSATDGALYAAAFGAVMREADGRRVRLEGPAAALGGNPYGMGEDERGRVWIAFYGAGLCRADPGASALRCYTMADGLPSAETMSLLADRRGGLWLGSYRGLARMPLAAFDRVDGGQARALTYTLYGGGPFDGLRDAEANSGSPGAIHLRSGHLAFATVGGLAVTRPAWLRRGLARLPPRPIIEAAYTATRSFPGDTTAAVTFATGERDVRFDVAAFSLGALGGTRLATRLEGLDRAWRTLPAGDPEVRYTNLRPGRYRLDVLATAADGRAGRTSFAFRVPARPHETAGFYVFAALAVLGVAAAVVRLRSVNFARQRGVLEAEVAARTAELRAREHDLAHLNDDLRSEVARRVDEFVATRTRYEADLVAARDTAEAGARAREAILRNVTHEVRTPIAAILGFSDILAAEAPPELREFADYIDENGKRLLHMLNDVLDLARFESGGVEVLAGHADAADVARGVAGVLGPLARRKRLDLRVDAPATLPILIDAFAVERIVTNLVSNAIKFTDEGGVTVTVAGEPAPRPAAGDPPRETGLEGDGSPRGDAEAAGTLVLTVADTGRGISAAFLPHLFEPFKQEDAGLARAHEGSGIGLTLVRRIIEAHGGAVAVESTPGAGTTFTVRLPNLVGPGTFAGPGDRAAPGAHDAPGPLATPATARSAS